MQILQTIKLMCILGLVRVLCLAIYALQNEDIILHILFVQENTPSYLLKG